MTIGQQKVPDLINTSNKQQLPLLTIVTVCRNAASHLPTTLDSVASQTVRADFEYVVIDGASTDGTLDIIQAAAENGVIDRWVSEKDKGIYDAMNKAVALATGEWILFMNSADVFETTDALESVFPNLSEKLSSMPETGCSEVADIIYGDCIMVYPDGSPIYDAARPPVELSHRMICSHQSLLARRQLLISQPFNTAYTICADYDFLLGMWIKKARFCYVPVPIGRVQLEYYTFPQITIGHRQKREAAMARLGYFVRFRFDLGWLALAVKHLIKRMLGRATLRRTKA